MKLTTRLVLALIALGGASPVAEAQRGLFELIDIRTIERAELTVTEVATDPPVIRESEAFLSANNAPASPDQSLARPVARIGFSAEGLRRIPAPSAAALDRAALPMLEFTVAGYLVRMAVVEARADRDFDAVHYTLLAPDSGDYARLTVSRSGQEVVGTFVIDDHEFRILPENEDHQLVYPVVAHIGGWRRENAPALETRSGQLEARHLQIGWIAAQRPVNFDTHADGRPYLYAGSPALGRLNFWTAFEFDRDGQGVVDTSILKTEIETYLNRMSHFTWVYDPIEVEILGTGSTDLAALNSLGLRVEMRQLIYGIPVSDSIALKVVPSVDVMEFNGALMRYAMAPDMKGERIVRDEAIETSRQALLNAYGIEASTEPLEQQLLYRAVSTNELELIWIIERRADCGLGFAIEIDAITGRANEIRITDAGDFRGGSERDFINQCRYQRFLRPTL